MGFGLCLVPPLDVPIWTGVPWVVEGPVLSRDRQHGRHGAGVHVGDDLGGVEVPLRIGSALAMNLEVLAGMTQGVVGQ